MGVRLGRTKARQQHAVSHTSATTEARVGGELYERVTSPAGARVIVGDVQGKRLDAVETAAVVLGAFREAAHDEPDLVSVSARLEPALNRRLAGEEFVTAVLAEVNHDRTVTLLNCGRHTPMILRADGTCCFVEPPEPAPPLGLADFGPKGPVPRQVPLFPGDQMLLYTDGVTEARDHAGRFYPSADAPTSSRALTWTPAGGPSQRPRDPRRRPGARRRGHALAPLSRTRVSSL